MAKSAKERKRASLERKAAEARKAGDPTDALATRRFFEFIQGGHPVWDAGVDNLAIAGFAAPIFSDDSDDEWSPDIYDEPYRGSIGRAERMVGLLLDAAHEFASTINAYKREAIDSAIAAIQQSDLTDPDAKAKALTEVVRLTKLRDQLEKMVRWELPEWQVPSKRYRVARRDID